MASDFEKPNKVHTLFSNEVKKKMYPLPVSELFMIGKSSSKKLMDMGITTIGELAEVPCEELTKRFKSMGKMMKDFANGIDDSLVEENTPKNQGIGHSTTLPEDVDSIVELKKVIRKLSDMVGINLLAHARTSFVISAICGSRYASCVSGCS
jgi:DNA polymerase-4